MTSRIPLVIVNGVTKQLTVGSDTINPNLIGNIPANVQSTSYTLALTDVGLSIDTIAGVTFPPNSSVAFAIGDTITITNTSGSSITITQGSGVTLRMSGTALTGNRTLAQYGLCTARKIATDVWIITGSGLT
jgi:hypothetical protein